MLGVRGRTCGLWGMITYKVLRVMGFEVQKAAGGPTTYVLPCPAY